MNHQAAAESFAIKDVATQTGLAAGTIRMWEQRFGFPVPARSESGYRQYSRADIEALRRVVSYRHRGLSVPAAIERAREVRGVTDRPSIYAAVASAEPAARPQVLRKSTLIALSRAIEHEVISRAASPVVIGAFQEQRFFAPVSRRYEQMACTADATVVFADFPAVERTPGGTIHIPIAPGDALGNEWAVIVDAPGYAACLLAWEQPGVTEPGDADDGDRRFECLWTIDPRTTRRAARVGAQLAARADAGIGAELTELLEDRPMAVEEPAPALTALTNRALAYVEAAAHPPRP